MPLAIVVAPPGGADFIALHPTHKGTEVAVGQVDAAIRVGGRGSAGGEEAAVGVSRVEPEADTQLRFGKVDAGGDHLRAVELHGAAVEAGHVIGRADPAAADAIVAACAIAVAAFALPFVEVVERRGLTQRFCHLGSHKGDFQTLYAAGKVARVAHRAGQDYALGQQGGAGHVDGVAVLVDAVTNTDQAGDRWCGLQANGVAQIGGGGLTIVHVVSSAHTYGVLTGGIR